MTKYMVIGDIHGCLYKVQQLEHLFSTVDKIIFVGDYIDRGPDPLGVLEFVANVPNAICLTGNHEWKYIKKIRKGQRVFPQPLVDNDFDKFKEALIKVVGEQSKFWYKDENISASHAPAALWQHDWNLVKIDKFLYGWTIPNVKDANGFPTRIPLEEKFPGEVSEKPVIFGHIHSDKIELGNNLYCTDLKCGEENGKLGAAIFENSILVETIKV